MSIWAKGSFSGRYEPRGEPGEADSIALIEFAVPQSPESIGAIHKTEVEVLRALFRARSELSGAPIFANRFSAAYMATTIPELPVQIFQVAASSSFAAENTGTWGELQQVYEAGYRHPLLIGQAFHIGRVAMQAEKMGLDPIVPPGLPREFDAHSSQPFTRHWLTWVVGEFVGAPVLRRAGHL